MKTEWDWTRPQWYYGRVIYGMPHWPSRCDWSVDLTEEWDG